MIVELDRDLAAEREYSSRLCVIGSFPRSGSHWTRRMLALHRTTTRTTHLAQFIPDTRITAQFVIIVIFHIITSCQGAVRMHTSNALGRKYFRDVAATSW